MEDIWKQHGERLKPELLRQVKEELKECRDEPEDYKLAVGQIWSGAETICVPNWMLQWNLFPDPGGISGWIGEPYPITRDYFFRVTVHCSV
ncbi:MAG: hypothetical protein OXE92_10865 [Bacteroidetes bacterium]|nr:hypothetical protein [Bacteroidota bacterium]